jgi:hypothetical protein
MNTNIIPEGEPLLLGSLVLRGTETDMAAIYGGR